MPDHRRDRDFDRPFELFISYAHKSEGLPLPARHEWRYAPSHRRAVQTGVPTGTVGTRKLMWTQVAPCCLSRCDRESTTHRLLPNMLVDQLRRLLLVLFHERR